MRTYYDENYGVWDMSDDPDEVEDFYKEVQRRSVEKKCVDCGRTVRIMPQYEVCDSCATRRESGLRG